MLQRKRKKRFQMLQRKRTKNEKEMVCIEHFKIKTIFPLNNNMFLLFKGICH